ncbi:hypothetical protein [Pseudomonas sp.]|uniref:hypothetical protein n=1 Tax=Pseudomonas sp. TaxID=306 RepID=UPI0029135986|nr:hypothetical protein [Pseudomonas sp.]MDU4254552.1 hypothetical protein [Pseudomonas sp.]
MDTEHAHELALKIDSLAQHVAQPGDVSWQNAAKRAWEVITSVTICRPCPACGSHSYELYGYHMGWVEQEHDWCDNCSYHADAVYLAHCAEIERDLDDDHLTHHGDRND